MPRSFLVPSSNGRPENQDQSQLIRERGWTDAARAAAAQARRAAMKPTQLAKKIGGMKTDEAQAAGLSIYGPEAGKQIQTNLGIRVGVHTKTGQPHSTFMSNDRKQVYSGRVRGMRQKIMQWSKDNGKVLPSGFENRSPNAIVGMFRGMAKAGHFNK